MSLFNDAFWAWFGSSVMRNADGTPMVLYHGSPHGLELNDSHDAALTKAVKIALSYLNKPYPGDDDVLKTNYQSWLASVLRFNEVNPGVIPSDVICNVENRYRPFTIFSRAKLGGVDDPDARVGFFFTPNRQFAEHFLSIHEYDEMLKAGRTVNTGEAVLFSVYLRIENPLNLTVATKENAKMLASTELLGEFDEAEIWQMLKSASGSKKLQQRIARHAPAEITHAGFDGIINWVEWQNRRQIEVQVLFPEQVKSASDDCILANDGSWNIDDPDITSNPPMREPENNPHFLTPDPAVLEQIDELAPAASQAVEDMQTFMAGKNSSLSSRTESHPAFGMVFKVGEISFFFDGALVKLPVFVAWHSQGIGYGALVKWAFPNSQEMHYDVILNGKMKKREQAPERLRAVLYHETVHALQYLLEPWRKMQAPEASVHGAEAYLSSYPETDAWLLTITQIILEHARTANAKKAITVNIENDTPEAFLAGRWGLQASERNALEYYLADNNLRETFKHMLWYALQEELTNEPV